jgi:sugar fermentation stimulation protein A
MKGCYEHGCKVYLSRHTNPTRKLTYTLEMTELNTSLVGINTQVPNHLVKESISTGKVSSLTGYSRVLSEIPYGNNSRIDLLLENGQKRCFVEVKNCTLVADRVAYFPDAVSSRGLKHLLELERQVQAGDRSVMFYVIQRTDANIFKPADHIDPAYGRTLRSVFNNGVEIMVYDVNIDLKTIELNKRIPYQL